MKAIVILFAGITLALMLKDAEGGSACTTKCPFGQKCCGPINSRYCSYDCLSTPQDKSDLVSKASRTFSTIVIVGFVLGVTIVVGVVICCVCYMRNTRRPGHVIQTAQNGTVYQGSPNPAFLYPSEQMPPPYTEVPTPMGQFPPQEPPTGASEEKKKIVTDNESRD